MSFKNKYYIRASYKNLNPSVWWDKQTFSMTNPQASVSIIMQGQARITIFSSSLDIKDVHSLNDEAFQKLAGNLKYLEKEEMR